MICLIVGGSASGKSRFAERLCLGLGETRCYIAAMEAVGQEAVERVRRHRRQRRGMGMRTLECPRNLDRLILPRPTGVALLECAGTLLANEMFAGGALCAHAPGKVLEGILHLADQAEHLVVVSNDIFAGAERYEGGMAAYLGALGHINRELAARGSLVVEVVSGLPLVHKGEIQVKNLWQNKAEE